MNDTSTERETLIQIRARLPASILPLVTPGDGERFSLGERHVTPGRICQYIRGVWDDNPIHSDPALPKKLGFSENSGVFMPGVQGLGIVTGLISERVLCAANESGADFSVQISGVDGLRFSNPVQVSAYGATLEALVHCQKVRAVRGKIFVTLLFELNLKKSNTTRAVCVTSGTISGFFG